MSYYTAQIMKYAGVDKTDAGHIEEIMRSEIFHSTLDWVPRVEVRGGVAYVTRKPADVEVIILDHDNREEEQTMRKRGECPGCGKPTAICACITTVTP